MFHVANGVFIPNGEKVIVPNFVDPSFTPVKVDAKYSPFGYRWSEPELKKTAKNTLQHWTKESGQTFFAFFQT